MRRRRGEADHRPLGIAVALLAAAATWLSTTAIDGGPLEHARTARVALPAGGPILKDGDDVRISGVRVGQVREVALTPDGARATITIGDERLRSDAVARVQLRGLAGAVDVDLDPGDSGRELPDGALVRGSAGTQLTDVVAGFDADTRRALARTVQTFGVGLAGRGEALNRTLGNLSPALERLTPLLQAMRPAPGALGDFVVQAERVAAAVPADDLEGLVAAAAPTLRTLAARSDDLAATIDAAPALEGQAARTLPVADRLLDRLEPTVRALEPGVRSLAAALPDLQAVEDRGAALEDLARVGRAASPVLTSATPVVRALFDSTASLAALTAPVDDLVQYLLPYDEELVEAPAGFTRWGDFTYDEGQGKGHRAVRFSMVFTCAKARDPYPKPGKADAERERCLG
ncbi:MAG: MlaD family protein [Solirubrobacteraceae bacterium]